jgi:hypothetical protein
MLMLYQQYCKELFAAPMGFEPILCFRNSLAINALPYFETSHFGASANSVHLNA